jgi:C4-dicarboxylate transporter DctM subunit
MMALALFGGFLVLALLTVPIGVAIGISAFGVMLLGHSLSPGYAARAIVQSMDSFPLIAVPLFLLAGEMMSRGGMSQRLFDVAHLVMRGVTGGVPMAVVLAALLFGALSGSGAADTAAIGGIMIPAMVRMGYPVVFSATLIAAAGALAVVMPPSLPMIIYGITAQQSIGDLFLGGIVPAFLMAGSLMIYAHIYCRINGLYGDRIKAPEIGSVHVVLGRALLPLFMPVIILGGIYGGIFTPTEAAGVAVLYTLIICVGVYRTIPLTELPKVLMDAAQFVGPIMMILAGATVFRIVLSVEEIPQQIGNMVLHLTDNPYVFLAIVNVLLLLAGMVIDSFSAIIIFAPLLLPVATQLGIDPLHFGIVVTVNLAIGYISPPLAGNLFIVASISGQPFDRIAKGT